MTTIRITPAQLAPSMLREAKKTSRAVLLGARAAARRFQTLLVEAIDGSGITYQGHLKNSVHTRSTPTGAVVSIDAPHAGIIELGARPHPVSREGVLAIARWVMTKLHTVSGPTRQVVHGPTGRVQQIAPKDMRRMARTKRSGPAQMKYHYLSQQHRFKGAGSASLGVDEESLAIAYAIAATIKQKGAKPHYLVRNRLPMAREFYGQEVARLLKERA